MINDIKQSIIFSLTQLYNNRMTTTSGGNLSIIDEDQNIWITPSGIDKGSLKPEHIICIKNNGELIGSYKPSMEFPFHKAIYKARPDIKAIVHAHAPALVSFSITHSIPETDIAPHYKMLCGEVGYAPYSIPGSDDLGINIANEFAKGHDAVIMENHGAVVGSNTMEEAFLKYQALEYCARTHIGAKALGSINTMDKAFNKKQNHSIFDTESSKDNTILEQIKDIAKRAYKQEIMAGIGGTLSVIDTNDNFYFFNDNTPLWKADAENIHMLSLNKAYLPENELLQYLHSIIYTQNTKVGAIIIAHSPNIMAYAVADTAFDIGSIPESWMFLKNTQALTLEELLEQLKSEQCILSIENTLLIIKNQFIISTGKTLLEAFDRLEVADFSAKSLIQASNISKLCPISEKQISDLTDKFGSS